MTSYIRMLLDDIQKAHRPQSEELTNKASIEKRFRDIERFVSGDADQPLSYYCGLSPEHFPSSELISDEEKFKICQALNKMFESWNVIVEIPSEVPQLMRYRLLVNLLDKPFTPMQFGSFVFDFCTGCTENCELEAYCPCRD